MDIKKEELIFEIESFFNVNGSHTYSELDMDTPILVNSIGGRIVQQIETFYSRTVETVVYVDDEEFEVIKMNYFELSDEILFEIYEQITEQTK